MAKRKRPTMAKAKKAYARKSKNPKKDNCVLAGNLLNRPTVGWMKDPGSADVRGIDHPHKDIKGYVRNGHRVKGYVRKVKKGKGCKKNA